MTESLPRIVFMGTPAFAEAILRALVEANYPVSAVFTQPDKPSGRDQEMQKSAVKLFAEAKSIPVEQPSRLDDEAVKTVRKYEPDIIIVAAYGKILPQTLLDIPPKGCLNVHASLLPRWRGASPIQNALLAGDVETGVTIMKMDAGMDTGPVITREGCSVAPGDTTATLLPKLSETGARLLLSTLPKWMEESIEAAPQNESLATLCQLIEREDGKIFWNEEAETIFNRYRAFTPWPGIFSFWKRDGSLLRVKFQKVSLQKQNPETPHSLGEVIEIGDAIGVQTGKGVLLVQELQLEGKSSLSAADFARGCPDFVGAILE